MELAGITTFRGLVRATAAVLAEAYAHPDLPLEILMERAAGATGGARVPAFQVSFLVRQGSVADSLDFPGIRAESVPVDIGMSPVELMLEFDDPGPGRPLTGKLEYRTVRFETETIRRIADGYLAVLGQGVANPEHVPSPTDSLLPAPARIQATQASPGPRGGGAGLSETGTALSDLWRNVLGEVEVGPLDNFYDLGGDSLAAHGVIIRIERRFGVVIDPVEFGLQTLSQLSRTVEERSPSRPGGSAGGWLGNLMERLRSVVGSPG